MTTRDEVEAWILQTYSPSDYRREEWGRGLGKHAGWCALIDETLAQAAAWLGAAQFAAYETTSGAEVVTRFKAKIGKKSVTVAGIGASVPTAKEAIAVLVPIPVPETGTNIAHVMRDFIAHKLSAEMGAEVQARMDAARAVMKPSDRARQQASKNVQNLEASRRKAALERLAVEMRRYDFKRDDILEAWEMSQVERVQQS